MPILKAYQGDGKKRRSFLPAPKKTSPSSSQPPCNQFATGAPYQTNYTGIQQGYASNLPGATYTSSSSSVSPSSSVSSISLPPPSISPAEKVRHSNTPQLVQDDTRCGVGLRVGARVKIGGIKPGILRYLGTTHLAPGIFCGIELLEADGKHDGEVNGHRYFFCPPNCGIFAPKDKVCLDPTVSRLSSDSEGAVNPYSSSESLSERTYKALKSFEEGELELVDCSKISPDSTSPQGDTKHRRGRTGVEPIPDWGCRSTDSIDSQDAIYFHGRPRVSHLPRAGRSGIPAPSGIRSPSNPSSGSLVYQSGYSFSSHQTTHAPQHEEDNHTKHRHLYNQNEGRERQFEGRDRRKEHNRTFIKSSRYEGDIEKVTGYHEADITTSPSSNPAKNTFEVLPESPRLPFFRDGGAGGDVPLTSTPEPGRTAGKCRSVTQTGSDHDTFDPTFHLSSSDDNGVGDGPLSVTYSFSDEQLQPIPSENVSDGSAVDGESHTGSKVDDLLESSSSVDIPGEQRSVAGGYKALSDGHSSGGDGNSSRGLLPSLAPSNSCKSASYIVTSQGEDTLESLKDSHSYTVCAKHDNEYTTSSSATESFNSSNSCELSAVKNSQFDHSHYIQAKNTGIEAISSLSYTKLPLNEQNPPLAPTTSSSYTKVDSDNLADQGALASSLSYTVCQTESTSRGKLLPSSGSNHDENGGESSSSSGPPSSNGGGDPRLEHLDDSSTGVSPEVSQVLEWDYGQEFADGKIPPPLSRHHLNRHSRHHSTSSDATSGNIMTASSSTGTSESLSDALLRDVNGSEPSSDAEMTPASNNSVAGDDSDQFEVPDNDFENIDSLEDLDFPMLGKINASSTSFQPSFTKPSSTANAPDNGDETLLPTGGNKLMTDSGISEKDADSDMFKSTTSATSTSSTLCGGGENSNSLSDDCSRDDECSQSSTVLVTSGMSTSTSLTSSSSRQTMNTVISKNGVSSDSSQETLCIPDTPGSVDDVDFALDDKLNDGDNFNDASLSTSLDKRNRSKVKAYGSKTTSHSSEVLLEDINLVQKANSQNTKQINTSLISTNDCVRLRTTQYQDGGASNEVAERDGDLQDSAGLLFTKRERPISLLSTTSADTGYAPDTDSEVGTLTFNSPNTDWMDKFGVTHPTSFAPPDDSDLNYQGVSSSNAKTHRTQNRYNTDDSHETTTTNTEEEDDRIEADQLYINPVRESEPTTHHSTTARQTFTTTTSGDDDIALTSSPSVDAPSSSHPSDYDDDEDDDESDDLTSCQTNIDFSFKVNAPIDFLEEANASDEDYFENEEAEEKKRNPKRKPMTITRKRSENVSHKMPDTKKVQSRLADYIKTPAPTPRQQQNNSNKTNNKSKTKDTVGIKKRQSLAADTPNRNNSSPANSRRASSVDKGAAGDGEFPNGESNTSSRRHQTPPKQPPKPVIKRAAPKSKWGDIMSQIESSKGSTKPKPKSEIKSSLASYLNTPPPSLADKTKQDNDANVTLNNSGTQPTPRKKIESRIKPLPPPPPKIDLSRVKSKLGVPTAASANKIQSRRELNNSSSNNNNRSLSREGSPANNRVSLTSRKGSLPAKVNSTQGRQLKGSASAATTRTNSIANSSVISSARSSVTDLSLFVDGEADGAPSKQGSLDVSRRLSTNSARSEQSEKHKQDKEATKNGNSRSNRRTIEIKSNAPANNISKKPRANGTIKPTSSTPNTGASRGGATTTLSTSAAQKVEILRLESLCESRTKELSLAKMENKETGLAFDAMAVLVNYRSAELDAFKKQLADCMVEIANLNQSKFSLESRIQQTSQEKEEQTERADKAEALTQQSQKQHEEQVKELESTHDAALTAQRDELTAQHQTTISKLHEQHDRQIEKLKQYHERKTCEVKNENKMEMNNVKVSHLEEIQELRNKHDGQMEELHKQHRNKLEDITHRFESIKLTLSEKVESLRSECEESRQRAKKSEEALQRDADVKVQIAIAPFLNLPKEVESLKTVVEMRNEEIQRLRSKNMDLEKMLEEIPISREKIISLQQKVENLEAIVNIKTDHEKQLHEKCQVLMRKVDRESRANKTLSMEHEQILWRMSQSAEFGSSDSLASLTTSMTSLPGSLPGSTSCRRQVSRTGGGGDSLKQPRTGSSEGASPDLRSSPMRRSFHGGEEVQMRNKHGRSGSGSGHRRSMGGRREEGDGSYDRKLRSRSATFVVEKVEGEGDSSGSGGSHSLSSSPQTKPLRRRSRGAGQDSCWVHDADNDSSNGGSDIPLASNLSQSAGAVIHYELPHVSSPHKKRSAGRQDADHVPVIVSAACTSTPRQEAFDDSTTTSDDSSKGDTTALLEDETATPANNMMTASMGSTGTRSISSGVSDSGVYDSMTRSELLNSSMVSTDSEWGTASISASMTLDSTLDMDDLESRTMSGPKTRDYNSMNDVTMVPSSSSSSHPSSSSIHDKTLIFNSSDSNTTSTIALDESPTISAPPTIKDNRTRPRYNQQSSVSDDVFDEDMSMESCSFNKGQGQLRNLDLGCSMTSSTYSLEEVDEEEDSPGEGGFSVTCSDTVTDLAGVCSNISQP